MAEIKKPKDRVIKDGYLYIKSDIVFDMISGKYKLTVKKHWRENYTRRNDKLAFSYGYSNFHIFISKDIPFLTNENIINFSQNFNEIENNWEIILEYAIDKMNPELIVGFESEKYHGVNGDYPYIAGLLEIDPTEYLKLNEFSPYS